MRKKTCQSCTYFDAREVFDEYFNTHCHPAGEHPGSCRLNPPAVPLAYDGRHETARHAVWPVVYASDWCGQHREFAVPSRVADKPAGLTVSATTAEGAN